MRVGPPASGPGPSSPAPTLPAGVSLGLLQGLGGGGEGDALEDVDRVSKEAQLLVDALHEATFGVHGAQLGREGRVQGGSGWWAPGGGEPPCRLRVPRGSPETAPRKGPPASGTETPATCSYHWRSRFNPHPTPPVPQGVLLPESQRGLVQAMCLHSGKHSKKAGTGGVEVWLLIMAARDLEPQFTCL